MKINDSTRIMFSFQPNKPGKIYVEIKTQILRYASACSVGRKTYCTNDGMLQRKKMNLVFRTISVLRNQRQNFRVDLGQFFFCRIEAKQILHLFGEYFRHEPVSSSD